MRDAAMMDTAVAEDVRSITNAASRVEKLAGQPA